MAVKLTVECDYFIFLLFRTVNYAPISVYDKVLHRLFNGYLHSGTILGLWFHFQNEDNAGA